MARPHDEDGVALQAAHIRLNEDGRAPKLRDVAIMAMTADTRSCALTTAKKIRLIDQVIDHVVDGTAIPQKIFAKAPLGERFLYDVWQLAERAVREKWREMNKGSITA